MKLIFYYTVNEKGGKEKYLPSTIYR